MADYELSETQCDECGHPVVGYFQNRKLVKVDPCTLCGCARVPELANVELSYEELMQWTRENNNIH